MPVERFRNKEAYRKNLAYRHIQGIPMTATTVCIGKGEGKCHRVQHSKNPSRMKIDAAQRAKVAKRKRTQSRKRISNKRV